MGRGFQLGSSITIQQNTAASNFTPAVDDGSALGTTSLQWSDLFLASGGVINWNNGDVTITHSANTLSMAGGVLSVEYAQGSDNLIVGSSSRKAYFIPDSSGVSLMSGAGGTGEGIYLAGGNYLGLLASSAIRAIVTSAAISPFSDDLISLGTAALGWSDAYFASGAVLTFGAPSTPDVTITHSAAGVLSVTGSVGVGTAAPDTTLHALAGSAGTVAATAGSVITAENTGHCYIQMLSGNSSQCGVVFGDDGSSSQASLLYDHSTNLMELRGKTAGNAQMLALDANGNIGVGTATFGTNAAGVFAVLSGTAPTTGPADSVQFYSSDIAAGHTMPSFFCEGTQVIATGQADSVSSVRVKMRINGTEVTLLAI